MIEVKTIDPKLVERPTMYQFISKLPFWGILALCTFIHIFMEFFNLKSHFVNIVLFPYLCRSFLQYILCISTWI